MGHLNSPVRIKEIDFVILKLPQKKSPDPYAFTGKLYQLLEE